jgi:DNA-binding CsgD family transcriptional regulator
MPRASEDLANAYADLAVEAWFRSELAKESGDGAEAKNWSLIQEYCSDMARASAVDDDQYRFQRDKARWRREVSVDPTTIEACAPAEGEEADEGHTVHPLQLLLLEMALGHLSPAQRACFELVDGRLMTPAQAAAELGMKPGQVRTHLSRARQRIAERITPRLLATRASPPVYVGEFGARIAAELGLQGWPGSISAEGCDCSQ